jgi:hypothetical protein
VCELEMDGVQATSEWRSPSAVYRTILHHNRHNGTGLRSGDFHLRKYRLGYVLLASNLVKCPHQSVVIGTDYSTQSPKTSFTIERRTS